MSTVNGTTPVEKIDFSSDQEVRWCPGCGDYSILKQVETLLSQSGRKKSGRSLAMRSRSTAMKLSARLKGSMPSA